MPSRKAHLEVDRAMFEGREYNEVHRILDQFSHYPDMQFLQRHRKFLHHEEGIEYITLRFGEEAGKSATAHVYLDCGHIPTMSDYLDGTVDAFGYRTFRGPLLKAEEVEDEQSS